MARFPNHQRRASSDKGGGGPGPRYWLHNLNYNHEVVPHMLGVSPDLIVFLLSTSCKQQHVLFGVFYWLTLFWDGVFGSFITNTVILCINLAQSSPWKKSTPPPVVANVRYGQQLLLTYRDPHHSTIKIALLTTIWNSCLAQRRWWNQDMAMRDNAALQNVTDIHLLEYPIPPRPRPSSSSHKPTPGDISQTEQAIIDPLVSKGPEKF